MTISVEGLVIIVIIGLVAGWLAGQIMQGAGFGLLGNLVVGVLGAFVGGWLLPMIGLFIGGGVIGAIVNATIGAVVLLLVVRLFGGRLRRR